MSDQRTVKSFTAPRRRPTEIGRIPGLTLPWQFTLAQFGVGAAGLLLAVLMLSAGAPVWTVLPVLVLTLVAGRAIRRVRIDDRPLLAGLAGWARFVSGRATKDRLLSRTADAVVDNTVVGSDHSQWLLFCVQPASYGALDSTEAKLQALRSVQQLAASVGASRFRLFSTVDAVQAGEVVAQMERTSHSESWDRELAAELDRLAGMDLADRRFWLMVLCGDASPTKDDGGWLSSLAAMAGWRPPARASWVDRAAMSDRSEAMVARAGAAVGLRPATAAEARWLLDRVPVGSAHRPCERAEDDYPHLMLAPHPDAVPVGRGFTEGASAWRAGDAQWCEPLKRIALAQTDTQTVAHTSAVVSQLPDSWLVPGGGELLWAVDSLADPWEWLIDIEVVPNQAAVAKTRNQHRRLKNQYDEYGGDPAGAPPELDVAAEQIEAQRQALVETRSDEFVATVVLTTALAIDGDEDHSIQQAAERLCARLERLTGLAARGDVRVAAPSGDQLSARRMWLPRRHRAPISRDYRQYLLSDGLAGLGPCLQSQIGDPQGMLLGWADDKGSSVPVLFDPTLGPRARAVGAQPRSPSIGIAGKLGAGKSVFAKRVMWSSLMAGGAVVAVDRSEKGEYAAFAETVQGAAPELDVEIIDVRDAESGSLDPMRAIPDSRLAADTATLLLGFLGRIDPHGAAAARLALAAAQNPGVALGELARMAAAGDDSAASELGVLEAQAAMLAGHPVGGALFDEHRRPARLDADLVVLWAPGLALNPQPDTPAEVAASAVVLGTMLTGRAITFASVDRFAGLLLDEAWSLLGDHRARSVVIEGLRDGRKHNAAIWLASQSPSDFAASAELSELLGYVACFGVANEEAAVAAARLSGVDPALAARLLMGLPTGIMLWRDLFGRAGLVEVALPADPLAAAAIDTTPTGQPNAEFAHAEFAHAEPFNAEPFDAEFAGAPG
ncbi:MAG: ATP-binding protein [bacterium]|nr:ATP-binding protein [bacterium]